MITLPLAHAHEAKIFCIRSNNYYADYPACMRKGKVISHIVVVVSTKITNLEL